MARSELKSKAQVLDPKYITITDLSLYNPEVPVTSAVYRITLPNFGKYIEIAYIPSTVLNINSNILMLTNAVDEAGLKELPSGLYVINQSICPNDKVFVEYNYFNIAPDLKKLALLTCVLKDNDDALVELFELRVKLELAKTLAEECCKPKEAIALYNLTSKKIVLKSMGVDYCNKC